MPTTPMASNTHLPEGVELGLLDRLDFHFGHPDHTSRVGAFLNAEGSNFLRLETTDDPNAHEYFTMFQRYGLVIEDVLVGFCAKSQLSFEDVARACVDEMDTKDGAPSEYICVSYIAAALEFERFRQLVVDVNALLQYHAASEGSTGDEEMEIDSEEH